MNFTETQLERESIYQSPFVTISKDKIKLPNGHTSYRVVINHPGATCILAITAENKVILVRQFRYAVGEALLEIPAGKLDVKGESIESCALRELAEETPYTAERVELLHTFYTAPGYCDEKMYLFLAKGINKNSTLNPDTDEIVETVTLTREESLNAIKTMQIKDAKTLIALQFWLHDNLTTIS